MTNWTAAGSQQKTGSDVEPLVTVWLAERGEHVFWQGQEPQNEQGRDKWSWKIQTRLSRPARKKLGNQVLGWVPPLLSRRDGVRYSSAPKIHFFWMNVYIPCALLTERFPFCGSERERFLAHPWQHWEFCTSCPRSPSGVKAFTGDISTPLRHGRDIPEGRPRAVKLLHLLQLLLPFLLLCASTRSCVTAHHATCVVSCKSQLKAACDLLFCCFFFPSLI